MAVGFSFSHFYLLILISICLGAPRTLIDNRVAIKSNFVIAAFGVAKLLIINNLGHKNYTELQSNLIQISIDNQLVKAVNAFQFGKYVFWANGIYSLENCSKITWGRIVDFSDFLARFIPALVVF